LESWYRIAADFGLPDDAGLAERIAALNRLHEPHFARYPQAPSHPLADPTIVPDQVVEHLMTVCLPMIFPRKFASIVKGGDGQAMCTLYSITTNQKANPRPVQRRSRR
jgi:hypothetical protein